MTPPSREARAGGRTIAEAVALCGQDQPFLQALAKLYRCADAAVAKRGARCMGGGACCRFDLVDHRLYLSTGELAMLSAALPADASACRAGRCPYQLGPRCTARDRRPLG